MRVRPDRSFTLIAITLVLIAIISGCSKSAPPPSHRSIYASPEEIEDNFRGKQFVLGTDNAIALVQPPYWDKDRWLKLPFWFGVNILVPGVQQPEEGDYYVISEAELGKPLDAPGEWMIEAGSTLIKQQTVLQTSRTRYVTSGKLLPVIVQYMGKRTFTRPDGKSVEIPVVREVSLPMKWTLGGRVPQSYARYRIE